jgi:hypothetical protein
MHMFALWRYHHWWTSRIDYKTALNSNGSNLRTMESNAATAAALVALRDDDVPLHSREINPPKVTICPGWRCAGVEA